MCIAKIGESVLSIVRDLFYWCAYLWALKNLQIKDASEISQVTFHSSGFKWIQKTWPVLSCLLETPGLCSDLCSSWIFFFPSVLLGSTVNHMCLSTPCVLLFHLFWDTTCSLPVAVSTTSSPSHRLRSPFLSPFFLLDFKSESVLLYCFLHSLRKLVYCHLGCEPEAHNTPSFLCLRPLRLCWLIVCVCCCQDDTNLDISEKRDSRQRNWLHQIGLQILHFSAYPTSRIKAKICKTFNVSFQILHYVFLACFFLFLSQCYILPWICFFPFHLDNTCLLIFSLNIQELSSRVFLKYHQSFGNKSSQHCWTVCSSELHLPT